MKNRQVEINPMSEVHTDDRRGIFEIPYAISDIDHPTVLVVKTSAKLGNHYHRDLTEIFLCCGDGKLLIQPVTEAGEQVGERAIHQFTAAQPVLIKIPPFNAHLFIFDGPGTLICLANQPFNPDDMPTFKLD